MPDPKTNMTITVPISITAEVKGDLVEGEDASYFSEIVAGHVQRLLKQDRFLLSEDVLPHSRWKISWKNTEISKEVKT